MSYLTVIDGTGATKHLAASGDGTPESPYVMSHAMGDSDALIGSVSAPDAFVAMTPVLDFGNAHTEGDVLFDATELANAVRAAGENVYLQAVHVIDTGKQVSQGGLTLYFFADAVTFGTLNDTPGISAADAADFVGKGEIASSQFVDLGNAAVASQETSGLAMTAASTSLYVAATCAGTPTPVAANDLTIKFGFIRA